MNSSSISRLSALAVLFGSLPVQAADFVLAERGRPADCTIVIPQKATPVQTYAAEELRDSGVALLPIFSAAVATVDTRFWNAAAFCRRAEELGLRFAFQS